jgi:hypothetical protein
MTPAKTSRKRWVGFVGLTVVTAVMLVVTIEVLVWSISTSCCTGT